MSDKILVFLVDDETEILNALTRVLRILPVEIITFTSPAIVLEECLINKPNIIISDQRMPFMNGLDLLTVISDKLPSCSRILLSAFQDFDVVINGFNSGAIQYFLSKPWDNKKIRDLITSLIPDSSLIENKSFPFIGEHQSMIKLKNDISRVAGANVPIFIFGETGSGKELVAKSCHHFGVCSDNPYIAFNCANLSESLIESQLFGHKKGAFTGADKDFVGLLEQAGKGSVFLDEVTTLPLELQAKLLRVIQEREFTPLGSQKVIKLEAQIISASSISLKEATLQGKFRSDLYYRLGVIKLSIPALREREEDIVNLAVYFLNKFNAEYKKDFTGFSESAIESLLSYDWPGNVRELENKIHQIIIMNDCKIITEPMLSSCFEDDDDLSGFSLERSSIKSDSSEIEGLTLEVIERNAIKTVLNKYQGNVTLAAASLGINPSTIYRKMSKWK